MDAIVFFSIFLLKIEDPSDQENVISTTDQVCIISLNSKLSCLPPEVSIALPICGLCVYFWNTTFKNPPSNDVQLLEQLSRKGWP